MKNIFIIISLVLCFFALALAAYFIGFKIYFSSDKIIKRTQRLVRLTFQRDSEISAVNLSPFGKMSVSSFKMAQKGGFSAGTTLSVKSVSSKSSLAKLLKRELVFNPFKVSGAALNLNYSGKRKLDYKTFFDNTKYIFYSKSARHGLIKSAEINDISFEDSSVIVNFDFGDRISGSASFDFSFKEIKTSASFDFVYKSQESVIELQNIICKDFNVSADAVIKLNADGSVSPEYTARINKQKLLDAVKDFPLYKNMILLAYPEAIDEIILIYPR